MNSHERRDAYPEDLGELRRALNHGLGATQTELDELAERLSGKRDVLRTGEKDEALPLVDESGNAFNGSAPRWLCHLLGLRHAVVHVLLRWQSPSLGNVYVLQVRSWRKADSPGHLDISVGGHVAGDATNLGRNSEVTAYREMQEELGIERSDLASGGLIHVDGYEFSREREEDNFYNTEWREVFLGDIATMTLQRIRFNDKEVVGLYLCPQAEARRLLNQEWIPLASGLTGSLPKCLDL